MVSPHLLRRSRGLTTLGLEAGDHLVTVLQNRWEAATLHWACQFAGIIITPLNWRASADELDFCLGDCGAKALVYEDVSAEAVGASREAQARPRIVLGLPAMGPSLSEASSTADAGRHAACGRRRLVGDALHLGHDRAAEGRAAPPARGTRRGARACGAESLSATASARSA